MNNLQGKTIVNSVIKDEVTFVHTAGETHGEKTVLDITLQPGGSNALHYHKSFEETFEVLEGELMVQIGKEKKRLVAGERATARIRDVHKFYSKSDEPTRFMVTTKPGHTGFENTIAIAYGLANDGLTTKKGVPKKMSDMAILAVMSDSNVPGFFSLIFKLLERKTKRPKSLRKQEELIKRYCY